MNRILLTLALVLTAGCHHHDHDHHGHADDHGDGHAHAHGASDEHPIVAATRWGDRTELFIEYPTLVAGRVARSAIHVTDLAEFTPLANGEVAVVLRGEDGRELEYRDGASRPGVYGVDVTVDTPGDYEMALRVEAPGWYESHELGTVTVHAQLPPLVDDDEHDEGITFLKEQQWTLEFGTVLAAERRIRGGIDVPAIVEPRPGGDARLAAPVAGRIDPSATSPSPGTRVRAGQRLVRITPRSDGEHDAPGLRAALVEAEQAHALAVGERDRAQRLVASRALPHRRLDEAAAGLVAAEARLDAARERWGRFESLRGTATGTDAGGAYVVRAPIDGIVSEVRVVGGVSVEPGAPLLRVVDLDRVHVVGAIPETRADLLSAVSGGELSIAGRAPIALGPPVTVTPVIDARTRTAEVRFELDNRDSDVPVGQAATLHVFVGDDRAGIAVPSSAIVDDGGRPVVYVQVDGETFERRPVRLGNAAAGHVHVVDGVEAGERIVHRGAYLVRLASIATDAPSHGHVH